MLIVHNNLAFLQLSCKGLKLFQNKSLKFKICFGIKEGNLQKATGNLTVTRSCFVHARASHPGHYGHSGQRILCSEPSCPLQRVLQHPWTHQMLGAPPMSADMAWDPRGGTKSPSENGWTVLSPGREPSPQPAWPCAQPAYSEGMCRPVAGLQPGPCLPRVSPGRRHPGHGSAAVAAADVSASQSRKCLAS